MKKFRKSFTVKVIAVVLVFVFLGQVISPTMAYALTSGPSQPEVTQFQPVSSNNMVDLFTGDFSYNIPLLELPGPNGGYPFNLSYQGNPTMDQEASWVGLGWNVNPGSIVRNMRGLPDDFNGDQITKEMDMKKDFTVGLGYIKSMEMFGGNLGKGSYGTNLNVNPIIYVNSYKGIGYSVPIGLSFQAKGGKMTYGVGVSFLFDSQNGVGANADFSLLHVDGITKKGTVVTGNSFRTWSNTFGMSIGYHSSGSINAFMKYSHDKSEGTKLATGTVQSLKNKFGSHLSSTWTFASPTHLPSMGNQLSGFNMNLNFTYSPKNNSGAYFYQGGNGFFNISQLAQKNEALNAYGYLYLDQKSNDQYLSDFNRENDGVIYKTMPNLHTPVLTYDLYHINGQGIGGQFRPYRNEIGYVHEQKRNSSSGGFSLGGNLSMDIKKFGLDGAVNVAISESGKFDAALDEITDNNFTGFRGKQSKGNDFEGPYFKMNGEHGAVPQDQWDQFGGEEPVRFKYYDNTDAKITKTMVKGKGNGSFTLSSDMLMQERQARETNIISYYNHQLTQTTGAPGGLTAREQLNEYLVKYYGPSDNYISAPANSYYSSRNISSRKDHVAGFTVLNADGSRYVYALPVYNKKHQEYMYSHKLLALETCKTTVDISNTIEQGYKEETNSENFKSIVSTPEYSHAHLLTSVLGTDYIDMDNDGPDDEDYGYWVKFNYKKVHDEFKWRSPFGGAAFNRGIEGTYEDDKISFTYGEKEIWYLATAETKTHIVVFEISPRADGFGPKEIFNRFREENYNQDDMVDLAKKLYKLDKIKLYVKSEYRSLGAEAVPVQTIHFEYDYSLCKNVPNNYGMADYNKDAFGNNITTGPDGGNINPGVANPYNASEKIYGKLTLKAVYFTYKTDVTGRHNKYKFEYNELSNFNYDLNKNRYDRWGTYNWNTAADPCQNLRYPYTAQFFQHPYNFIQMPDGVDPSTITTQNNLDSLEHDFKSMTDRAASAWNLTKVTLPSGGSLNIEYESDDYAYVQHKEVTQMYKITGLGEGLYDEDCIGESTDPTYDAGYDPTNPYYSNQNRLIYRKLDATEGDLPTLTNKQRRIYFKLEEPVRSDEGRPWADINKDFFNQYVEPLYVPETKTYQLYCNARVGLRGNIYDNISGYYNLITQMEPSPPSCGKADNDTYPCGVSSLHTESLTKDGYTHNYYTHGYITIDFANIDGKPAEKYHPFAINSWYYMKSMLPKVIYSVADYSTSSNEFDLFSQWGSLLSVFPTIAQMFKGYNKYCYDDHFAQYIDIDASWVRLGTPDRIKYGGGSRVKKIYMQDDAVWKDADQPRADQVGQVYEYTLTDSRTGKVYSSGIASYEPMIGGEENPLKFAKNYPKNIPLHTENNAFFEYPFNESYFPAPQVGYSKVTVKSMNTDKIMQMLQDNNAGNDDEVEGNRGTGITVHEFYTAKDFPTITKETDIEIDDEPVIVPIPLIGMITDSKLWASQGYLAILNDMHGKPKGVTTYGMDKDGNILSQQPVSSVVYTYFDEDLPGYGKDDKQLKNIVTVLKDDPILRGEKSSVLGAEEDAITENMIIGTDYEMFYDMRQMKSTAGEGGLDMNFDVPGEAPFLVPLPFPWPSFSYSSVRTNLVVTNKIIYKTGVLKEIKATDGQSTIVTTNKVFDKYTGAPLLTTVQNEYDKNTYAYEIPSYLFYSGTDAAYKNILWEFTTPALDDYNTGNNTFSLPSSGIINTYADPTGAHTAVTSTMLEKTLEEGDEFIMIVKDFSGNEYVKMPVTLAEIKKAADPSISCGSRSVFRFHSRNNLSIITTPANYNYTFLLTRSGKRNLLGARSGNMVALSYKNASGVLVENNPLTNRVEEVLSPSSVPAYATEFTQWLNSLLSGGVLPLGSSSISGYSTLSSIFDFISIYEHSSTASETCNSCKGEINGNPYTGNIMYADILSFYGFFIRFKPEYGGQCYKLCYAVPKTYDNDGTPTPVTYTSFTMYSSSAGSMTILANFASLILGNEVPYLSICIPTPRPSVNVSIFKIRDILAASVTEMSHTWNSALVNLTNFPGMPVNPYAVGIKGIWREKYDKYYKDERFQADPSNIVLRSDGVFDGHAADRFFYFFNWKASPIHPLPSEWLANNEVTLYNQNGIPVEAKDILGIYSASLYDKNGNLPIAVAGNAGYNDIFFTNFDNTNNPAITNATVQNTYAFTGKYALKLTNDALMPLTGFKPKATNKYIVSLWAGGFNMKKSPKALDADFPNLMSVKLKFYNNSTGFISEVLLKTSGFIYEGVHGAYWRRIESVVTAPANSDYAMLYLTKTDNTYLAGSFDEDDYAMYDDIRIYPYDGQMETFVYDVSDFRLKAESDENNYPTVYGYDASGKLTTVKKMTETGLKTITESYYHIKKQ